MRLGHVSFKKWGTGRCQSLLRVAFLSSSPPVRRARALLLSPCRLSVMSSACPLLVLAAPPRVPRPFAGAGDGCAPGPLGLHSVPRPPAPFGHRRGEAPGGRPLPGPGGASAPISVPGHRSAGTVSASHGRRERKQRKQTGETDRRGRKSQQATGPAASPQKSLPFLDTRLRAGHPANALTHVTAPVSLAGRNGGHPRPGDGGALRTLVP